VNSRTALIAQAARGPILLIVLGILFAMHQSGVISFSRSWPLIIIVLGVIKLIERIVAPPVPNFPPGGERR
jgi:cell wall-active antibiotic response 4TMS protein YvqF